MDFELPSAIRAKLAELDAFMEAEIKPLERDNMTAWGMDRRDPIEISAQVAICNFGANRFARKEIKIRRVAQYLFGFGHKSAE